MPEPISTTVAAKLIEKIATSFAEPAKGQAARAKEKLEVKFRAN